MTERTLSDHELECERRYGEIRDGFGSLRGELKAIRADIDWLKWGVRTTLASQAGLAITIVAAVAINYIT